MGRLATCACWAVAAVLATDGVARAQVPGRQLSESGAGQQVQAVQDSEERSGVLGAIRARLAEIFARERLQIHVNGAYQESSRQFQTETALRTYGETARLLTREEFRGGGHVDVGGSLRIWRGVLLGASFTQVADSGSAEVTGTVPHPLDVERDRTPSPQTPALTRRERATHAYLAWRIPWRYSLEVEFSAGPSYFSLRQGVVANVTPFEVVGPPFAEVGLQVDLGEHTRSGVGYNAGIDVTYMLTPATHMPQVGIGYFVRVTGGSVSLPMTADTRRRVSVGGVQTGAGFRLRF